MDYRSMIIQKFKEMREREPHLSLRQLSRKIDLDPSFVCRLLNKKIHITPHRGRLLVRAFQLSPDEKKAFLRSVYQAGIERRLRQLCLYFEENGVDTRLVHEVIDDIVSPSDSSDLN